MSESNQIGFKRDSQAMKKTIVNCPQCGKVVVWETGNHYRPFCSERCKLIDLGQWAAESYRIPENEKHEEGPGKEKKGE